MNEKLLDILRPDKTQNIEVYIETWNTLRNDFVQAINSITNDMYNKPMPDGSWSGAEISQHLAHTQCRFARVMPLALKGRIKVNKSISRVSNYAEIEEYFRNHRNANNPLSEPAFPIQNKNKSLESLQKAKNLFEQNICSVNINVLRKTNLDHFLFGPLNLVEYTWVLTMHENHHSYFFRRNYL